MNWINFKHSYIQVLALRRKWHHKCHFIVTSLSLPVLPNILMETVIHQSKNILDSLISVSKSHYKNETDLRLIFMRFLKNPAFIAFPWFCTISSSIKSHETMLRLTWDCMRLSQAYQSKVHVDVFLSYIAPVTFLILA